jgi:hypothetical protein
MDDDTILSAIGSQEPSSFSEFCRGLRSDMPERGDTKGWRELFQALESLESRKLIVIDRVDRSIDSLILTDAGADIVRSKLDSRRGLFAV